MKKRLLVFALMGCIVLSISACKKKDKEIEIPVDEQLTAVGIPDLEGGSYYVKTSGGEFYKLPLEDGTISDYQRTNDESGMTGDNEGNRLLSFTYKDNAIPTLYKNDELVYVASDVPSFIWERYNDLGYSIGICDLVLADSGKINYTTDSHIYSLSSLALAFQEAEFNPSTFTVDSINGITLDESYLGDGGIITGFSKDATATTDIYMGTEHAQLNATADTRFFKSFEYYKTDEYSLSPDGYAIIEIPDYFKSGYYLINNTGFVKYINLDRGNDESTVNLTTPYFYKDKETGDVLSFYEYQEKNGISGSDAAVSKLEEQQEDPTEVFDINIDNTQESLTVNVDYSYNSDKYRSDAKKSGKFPRVNLVSPIGDIYPLEENTNNSSNDGKTYLSKEITGAYAGTWQLKFYNFNNITKNVQTDIASGNSNSFVQAGGQGSISIYYEGSETPHEMTVTWEKTNRAAEVTITAPDGTKYSKADTPGNIVLDEYGKFIIKLPNLVSGDYKFSVKGEELGRVWVSSSESVDTSTQEIASESGEAIEESSVDASENIEAED